MEKPVINIQSFVDMIREEFENFIYSEEWQSQHGDAIKQIGESIFQSYGFPGMQQVYRGYAEPLPHGLGDIRASVLSKMWNGIGGWEW